MMLTLQDNSRNRLTLFIQGVEVGLIDYMIQGQQITVMHTEVYQEFTGKGYAQFLVQSFLNIAHLRQLQQAAICPYAMKYFEKHGITNYA